MKPAIAPVDQRRRDLATIHIAKAELNMAEDTYRNLLWTVGRVKSSADLDHAGRRKVLDHFKACGWSGKTKAGKAAGHPGKPRNATQADRAKLVSKVEALLADAERPWTYADAMAKRMFGVDLLTFTTPEQLHKIVSALMYDQKRRKLKKEAPNGQ